MSYHVSCDLNQVVFHTANSDKSDIKTCHVCFCRRCVRTWAPEFILLGGYDQEPGIMPSSQQDVDLKKRAWKAAQKFAQGQFNMKQRDAVVHEIQLQKKKFCFHSLIVNRPNLYIYNRYLLLLQIGIGSAVPNNAKSRKLDRGNSKIANADPDLLSRFPTWISMQEESSKLLKDKEDQLVRNFANKANMQTEMHMALSDDTALDQIWQTFRSSCIAEFL